MKNKIRYTKATYGLYWSINDIIGYLHKEYGIKPLVDAQSKLYAAIASSKKKVSLNSWPIGDVNDPFIYWIHIENMLSMFGKRDQAKIRTSRILLFLDTGVPGNAAAHIKGWDGNLQEIAMTHTYIK